MSDRFEDIAPTSTAISDVGGEVELADRLRSEMLVKLEANRGKRHWQDAEFYYLFSRLTEEVLELKEAWDNGGDVWAEAADVANFAAFIADNSVSS